jgi:hypothetical protein
MRHWFRCLAFLVIFAPLNGCHSPLRLPGDGNDASACDGGTVACGVGVDVRAVDWAASGQCEPIEALGGFVVELVGSQHGEPPSTTVRGAIRDRADLRDQLDTLAVEGDCRIVAPRIPRCNPQCGVGDYCANTDQCTQEPMREDVGTVTIDGLATPVTIAPQSERYWFYSNSLPFPPFSSEGKVVLTATGGALPGFTVQGRGIAVLELPAGEVSIARDRPLVITWNGSATMTSSGVQIELELARSVDGHAYIQCMVPDSGTAVIPANLIAALMARGLRGFPRMAIARKTVNSARLPQGCIEFTIQMAAERVATIDGLSSCRSINDCSPGQSCGADLFCH